MKNSPSLHLANQVSCHSKRRLSVRTYVAFLTSTAVFVAVGASLVFANWRMRQVGFLPAVQAAQLVVDQLSREVRRASAEPSLPMSVERALQGDAADLAVVLSVLAHGRVAVVATIDGRILAKNEQAKEVKTEVLISSGLVSGMRNSLGGMDRVNLIQLENRSILAASAQIKNDIFLVMGDKFDELVVNRFRDGRQNKEAMGFAVGIARDGKVIASSSDAFLGYSLGAAVGTTLSTEGKLDSLSPSIIPGDISVLGEDWQLVLAMHPLLPQDTQLAIFVSGVGLLLSDVLVISFGCAAIAFLLAAVLSWRFSRFLRRLEQMLRKGCFSELDSIVPCSSEDCSFLSSFVSFCGDNVKAQVKLQQSLTSIVNSSVQHLDGLSSSLVMLDSNTAQNSQIVSNNVRKFVSSSSEASMHAKHSLAEIESVVSVLENVEQHVLYSKETITQLHQKTEQIQQALAHLLAIAEQSNLLAINAVIEAKRAGETGVGLAVTANEVRNISEETVRSIGEFRPLISIMQQLAGDATNNLIVAISKSGEGEQLAREACISAETVLASNRLLTEEARAVGDEMDLHVREQQRLVEDLRKRASSLQSAIAVYEDLAER